MLSKLISALRYALVCSVPLVGVAAIAQATINVGPGQTYTTIQSGINAAVSGDTVMVAPGTYNEHIDFIGKSIIVESTTGAAATIIDGGGGGPVVTIMNAPGTLSGFTIQNGGRPQTGGGPQGGVYIANTSPQIQNNVITKTYCAGINTVASNAEILSNHINQTLVTGCAAQEGLGSGLAMTGLDSALPIEKLIIGNIIELNTASVASSSDSGGGGAINITAAASGVQMSFNILRNNVSTGYGGALYIAYTPSMSIDNNLVYGNQGLSGGLEILVPGDSVGQVEGYIRNNTVVGNNGTAADRASDFYIAGNLSQYELVNNLIIGYGSKQITLNCGIVFSMPYTTPLVFDHNDIYSVPSSNGTALGATCPTPPAQVGNVSVDPQFVQGSAAAITAGMADFHLSAGSSVIDAGNNSAVVAGGGDLDQKPRVEDGTGIGYPVVDMGAYEFTGPRDASVTNVFLLPSTYTPSIGGSVNLTATLQNIATSGTVFSPAGDVTFYEDYTPLGSSPIAAGGTTGTANYLVTHLTAGLHHFVAMYQEQGGNSAGVSIDLILNVVFSVSSTTTTLVSSVNPSTIGQSVTFTAQMAASDGAVPTGDVQFADGGTVLGTEPISSAGVSTYSTGSLAVGSHSITATYQPTGSFTASSAGLTQVVDGYATSISVTCAVSPITVGGTMLLSATVSSSNGTPTGSVEFSDNGALLGAPVLVGGAASIMYTGVTAGTHLLAGTYVPTGLFGSSPSPAACNETVTGLQTTSVLSVTPTTVAYGSPVLLTATVTPATPPGPSVPTGSVNFYSGTALLGSSNLSNGVASITTSALGAGAGFVTCAYLGDTVYATSNCNIVPITVNGTSTTTNLSVNPNPAYAGQVVTMTASVAVTATGAPPTGAGGINFFDGPAQIGSAQPNSAGVATFTTSALAVGTHAITAAFLAPGTSYQGSTSLTVNEVILPSTFTIALNPATITLAAAQPGTAAVQLASVGTFAGPLTLTFGALPQYATAKITPGSVTLTAGGTGSATFALNTLLKAESVAPVRPGERLVPGVFAALMLCLVPLVRGRRRKLGRLMALGLFAVAMQALTGCTNLFYPVSRVAAGTYPIVITATDANSNAQTATLTVVVTP